MKAIPLIALASAVYASPAFGCSIDMLKKLAEEHLERFPSNAEREFAPPADPRQQDSAGGSWQVFERESGTPHSIVVTDRNELGRQIIRISFLNRRDFVIIETPMLYADRVQTREERTGKFLIGSSESYFFCGGEPEVPLGVPEREQILSKARDLQKSIFEDDELKQDLARLPQ